MAGKGGIRKVFPGGNTCYGFYSFYDYILPQEEAERIFVIKGGPGVGKSTFMRKISDVLVDMGYDVEYEQCSADNDSLDGIVIPALKIALIDGTSPHVVDPKNPGAVDEIINLGEYWDYSNINSAKNEVIKVNKRVGKYFNTAYCFLKEAKVVYDEWKGYIKESMDWAKYNNEAKRLVNCLFENAHPTEKDSGKKRHLFASAITPGGLKDYMPTLLNHDMNIITVEGEPGSGAKDIISKIAQEAWEIGFNTEQFHCPFEPDYLDMVIIPGINTAVLNVSKPFHTDTSALKDINIIESINTNLFINSSILKEYSAEYEDAKARFTPLLDKAISYIAKAKGLHDSMEKYYVSSMNFAEIDKKRQEVLDIILEYAKCKC